VYTVTLICFNTDTAEDPQSTFDATFVTGSGADLHLAFEDAANSQSKKLFYGHNTLLILGRELCEKQLFETAVYLSQNREARLNISVFMADESAASLIRLHTGDKARISGSIEKLITAGLDGIDVKVQLFQIMQRITTNGVSGYIPVLRKRSADIDAGDSDGDDGPVYDVTVSTIAVFDRNNFVGEASGDVMLGVLLLDNRVNTMPVTVRTPEDGEAYGRITRLSTVIGVTQEGGDVRADIRCTGAVSVTGKSRLFDQTNVGTLRVLFEQEVAYILERAYDAARGEWQCDLFRIEWYMARDLSYSASANYFAENAQPEADAVCSFTIAG